MSRPGPWEHTTYDGNDVDQATKQALEQVADFLGYDVFTVTQGHNVGYGPSGGTHDGWGVVDGTAFEWERKLPVLKMCGFFAYHRTVAQGNGSWDVEHIHAGLVGDPYMSDAAKRQVTDWFAGLDGLYYHRADPDPWRPSPFVTFHYPLKVVRLGEVLEHIDNGAKNPRPSVKAMQWAMNRRMHAGLVVDGIWGPRTKAMYKRYEHQNGGDGNGVPGALTKKLGLASFRVIA